MNWQREFIAWHIATDHPWDVRLHMEAMTLRLQGLGRSIAEALYPVIEEFADFARQVLSRHPEEA